MQKKSTEGSLQFINNSANYTIDNIPNIVSHLLILKQEPQHHQPQESLKDHPSIKSCIQNISRIINDLNAEQTCLIAKCFGRLGIIDNYGWEKIEKHYLRNIQNDIKNEDIINLLEGLGHIQRKNESFLNKIEEKILIDLIPKGKFTQHQLIIMFEAINKLNIENQELISKLNQNTIDIIEEFTYKNFSKMLSFYAKRKVSKNLEFVTAVSSQVITYKYQLEGFWLQSIIVNLMNIRASDETINNLEDQIIGKMETFNLFNISMLSFAYATHYANLIGIPGNKNSIMRALEKYYSQNKSELLITSVGNTEGILIKLFWGLSVGNVVTQFDTWKELKLQIQSNPKFQKKSDSQMMKRINDAMKQNKI